MDHVDVEATILCSKMLVYHNGSNHPIFEHPPFSNKNDCLLYFKPLNTHV